MLRGSLVFVALMSAGCEGQLPATSEGAKSIPLVRDLPVPLDAIGINTPPAEIQGPSGQLPRLREAVPVRVVLSLYSPSKRDLSEAYDGFFRAAAASVVVAELERATGVRPRLISDVRACGGCTPDISIVTHYTSDAQAYTLTVSATYAGDSAVWRAVRDWDAMNVQPNEAVEMPSVGLLHLSLGKDLNQIGRGISENIVGAEK